MRVDEHSIIGKQTHHRLQIFGFNRGKGTYDKVM